MVEGPFRDKTHNNKPQPKLSQRQASTLKMYVFNKVVCLTINEIFFQLFASLRYLDFAGEIILFWHYYANLVGKMFMIMA